MGTRLEHWLAHRTFIAPTAMQSGMNCRIGNPRAVSSFHKVYRLRSPSERFCNVTIASLGNGGSPFYIVDLIMTLVIDTIQRVTRGWTFTDRIKKFFKRAKAKFNAALSIMRIGWILRVITATLRSQVCSVFWRIAGTVGYAGSREFIPTTSARLGVTALQIRKYGLYDVSAVAFAPPIGCLLDPACIPQNPEAIEDVSGDILKIMNGWFVGENNGILIVDHVSSFLADVMRSLRTSILAASTIIPKTGRAF